MNQRRPMFLRLPTAVLLFLSAAILPDGISAQQSLPAQSLSQQPAPSGQTSDPVVRISTQLVQLDTVVRNQRGEYVTSLTSDDFELFVDGKKRQITFSNRSVWPNRPFRRMSAGTMLTRGCQRRQSCLTWHRSDA